MIATVETVMQPAVKVVLDDESLTDLERAFQSAEVSGFPVVDKDGEFVGIVSRTDIVRQLAVEQGISEYVSDYYRDVQQYNSDSSEPLTGIAERVGRRLEQLRVKDFMTRGPIVTSPQTSLAELAQLFIKHHIHRVPVVANKRLEGIVTTMDLVRLFAERQATVGF